MTEEPLTNYFLNEKALGFTVVTNNRPFHLFAINPETRLSFLKAFCLIDEIPSKPKILDTGISRQCLSSLQHLRRVNSITTETTAASCLEEIPMSSEVKPRRYCLSTKGRPKVKIVPYLNNAMKDTFDSVSRAESSTRSIKRLEHFNLSMNIPFAIDVIPKTTTHKGELKFVKLNKQTKEQISSEKKAKPNEELSNIKREDIVNIKTTHEHNLSIQKEEQSRAERHVRSNSSARQSYRRPKRFSRGAIRRKANLSSIQDDFEHIW